MSSSTGSTSIISGSSSATTDSSSGTTTTGSNVSSSRTTTGQADQGVSLAVSTVIFALRTDESSGLPSVWLPLVRRIREPYDGLWALPGGPLASDEGLVAAAARTLGETTRLAPRYLEQLYAFGDLDRSPDKRVVSIVYWALVRSDEAARVSEGQNVRWFAADRVPRLAFDHNLIVDYALWRLRTKMEYSRIAHAFLGETFTLAQLREVHEAVLGKALDPANFRRSIEASDAVVPTGQRLTGTKHRPPRLYRYNTAIDLTDQGPLGATVAHPAARRPSAPKTPATNRREQ